MEATDRSNLLNTVNILIILSSWSNIFDFVTSFFIQISLELFSNSQLHRYNIETKNVSII